MASLKQSLNGVFAVCKPKGITSREAATRVQLDLTRLVYETDTPWNIKLKQRVKVGMGGILDPMAEGVLVLGVGDGCKKLGGYLTGTKMYEATAQFGQTTDTYDAEGKFTTTMPTDHIDQPLLTSILDHFRGNIMQKPPLYSSLKMDGKRLYEYAREGKPLPREIQARPVTIERLELLDFSPETMQASYEVECHGGTYVRSLLYDMGQAVNSCAYMTRLVRTQQGQWTLKDCLSLDAIKDLDLVKRSLTNE
ncbi:pseudouridine synthase [Hesseltinella vesiculosa]|uniref:tRNA pseudouridine(55) synthase n=1 Tax=Hesseltinella vesiculosa TaxID=101127 RepID=A0A1X2GJ32_9FUNG|nr:pseudouridine synthase [Hesseltinella vesiculosa]